MRKLLYIFIFLPVYISAQEPVACNHAFNLEDKYKNPLYDQYLSKYDVKFYHISLEVSNQNTYLDGFTRIKLEVLKPMDTLVFQLIDPHTITNISVNGLENTGFIHKDHVIYIPVQLSEGEVVDVKINYNGVGGQDRGFFAGISSAWDDDNKQQVTYTLSEPLNACDWFAVKQVLSDKADSVWVDLTCDKSLMAGSNGLLKELVDAGNGKHTFKWRSNYPIAYYLISLTVADYQDYSIYAHLSKDNDSVLVQNFIYNDENYFDTWKSRIDETANLINLYSRLVIDYPFAKEKYGHIVAPMGGGMEHQTMTTLANFNFNLVAHELAHQWFGDYVTCGNWQDIWVNEGFASYFEYIARQNLISQEEADNWMKYAQNYAFAAEGSVFVPKEQADDVYRVFDYGLTYKKGACLLHMIRYELDDDVLFFHVLSEYAEKYRFKTATADQFREVLDSVSGMDFKCFFDQWYYGEGYPSFNINWKQQNDTLYIESLQEVSNEATPLFKTHFDVLVKTVSGEQVVRFYQDEHSEVFKFPISEFVNNIEFDPQNFLLAKSEIQSTGFPEGKDLILGPNPFIDFLMLRFRAISFEGMLEVQNLNGEVVFQEYITTNPFKVDLSQLADGPYIIIIDGLSGQYREKVLKIKSSN